jgi:hypothetical protein
MHATLTIQKVDDEEISFLNIFEFIKINRLRFTSLPNEFYNFIETY